MKSRSKLRLPVTCLVLVLLIVSLPSAVTGQVSEESAVAPYLVSGVATKEARTAIARTGAGIDEVGSDYVLIAATPREVRQIRALGYTVESIMQVMAFPPADSNYHDYAEMNAEIQQAAVDHASIVSRFSMGKSYENRDLWAVKISDNVGADEDEPECCSWACIMRASISPSR